MCQMGKEKGCIGGIIATGIGVTASASAAGLWRTGVLVY